MRQSGKSLPAIARKFGLTKQRVAQILKPRPERGPMNDNDEQYADMIRSLIDKLPIGEQVKRARKSLSIMKAHLALFLMTMGRLSYAVDVMSDKERKLYRKLEREYLEITDVMKTQPKRKPKRPPD
jgi:hypothetical protein